MLKIHVCNSKKNFTITNNAVLKQNTCSRPKSGCLTHVNILIAGTLLTQLKRTHRAISISKKHKDRQRNIEVINYTTHQTNKAECIIDLVCNSSQTYIIISFRIEGGW